MMTGDNLAISLQEKYRKAFWILLTATTAFRLFYAQWIKLAPPGVEVLWIKGIR
jgi:hypothetical protein